MEKRLRLNFLCKAFCHSHYTNRCMCNNTDTLSFQPKVGSISPLCLQSSRAGADVDNPDMGSNTRPFCSPSHDVWVFGAIMYELVLGGAPPCFSKATLNISSSSDVHTLGNRISSSNSSMATVGGRQELFVHLQSSAFERSWIKAQAHLEGQ